MSPHTCQKGYHQKEQMINVGEDTGKALLVNTCVLNNAGIRKNSCKILCQFSSVTQSCPTLCNPMDCNTPDFPVLHQELHKLMSIELVMPSDHLILCRPFLLLPAILPSIRVFSNELALHIRLPKYWSFSFSIRPPSDYSELICFRINWFDLSAVQGTLKSLL